MGPQRVGRDLNGLTHIETWGENVSIFFSTVAKCPVNIYAKMYSLNLTEPQLCSHLHSAMGSDIAAS